MTHGLEFKDLVSNMSVDKTYVKDWQFFTLDKYDNVRLFYKDLGSEYKGFIFYCLRFNSCGTGEGSVWQKDDLQVEIVAAGTAYFDGLRHMYFHAEELEENSPKFDGYLYYPNANVMAEMFIKIRVLEEMYCDKDNLD